MLRLIIFVPIAIVFGSTGRARIAMLATTAVTWLGLALVEPLLLPDPFDRGARWRFYWLWLPAIAGVFASTTAALFGARHQARAFGAAWGMALFGVFLRLGAPTLTGELWECLLDVAMPATMAATAAVLAGDVPSRR